MAILSKVMINRLFKIIICRYTNSNNNTINNHNKCSMHNKPTVPNSQCIHMQLNNNMLSNLCKVRVIYKLKIIILKHFLIKQFNNNTCKHSHRQIIWTSPPKDQLVLILILKCNHNKYNSNNNNHKTKNKLISSSSSNSNHKVNKKELLIYCKVCSQIKLIINHKGKIMANSNNRTCIRNRIIRYNLFYNLFNFIVYYFRKMI